MQGNGAKLATAFLGLCSLGLAAVDCRSNVTITTTADARDIRENCQSIDGYLHIAANLTENINLDGLEVVKGGFLMSCVRQDSCPPLKQFNVTSSTLTEVHGSLLFNAIPGLQQIRLPKLQVVKQGLGFVELANATYVDLTDLEYSENITWDTPALERLILRNFKAQADAGDKESNFVFDIRNVGEIDSVDAFFRNAEREDTTGVSVDQEAMPNVEMLTVAWAELESLSISGCLTAVLGGPESKSMKIGTLSFPQGDVTLERNETLDRLEVEEFRAVNNPEITELNLQFDSTSSLIIDGCESLESIRLPSQAKDWKNLTVQIKGVSDSLVLTTQSDENGVPWYWPENDMYSLEIYANMADDFLDTLPKVTNRIAVQDNSGEFNCERFTEQYKEKHGLPEDYNCAQMGSAESIGALSTQIPVWVAGLVVLVLAL